MRTSKVDPLAIVEAAYEIDVPDHVWLQRLAEAVRPHLDSGFGLAAFEYFRPDDSLPQIVQSCHLGIPENLAAVYDQLFERMPPAIRQRPFERGPCITGSQMMDMGEGFREQPEMKRGVQRFGIYDSIWITAAEPTGRGCGFHAGRATIGPAKPAEVQHWGRIAAHLSSAVRLRHRVKELSSRNSDSSPQAVLNPDGKVVEATGDASTAAAREQLRQAVMTLEKSRGPLRETNPNQALADWRALVRGRWSLLDQIDSDGRRYIVARENDPVAPGPPNLTAREKQVLAYAKLGHHNKLIAYELGVADSTVRVLLARAAAKLGAQNRDELVRAFSSQTQSASP